MIFKTFPSKLLHTVLYRSSIRPAVLRKSTRVEEALFIKSNEVSVITLSEEEDVDIIGPPDHLSNLRPIIRKRIINETKIQEKLRIMQDETHHWNQDFWSKHNSKFIQQKQQFIDSNQIYGEEKRQLTAEEMSKFYKMFLDENWTLHVKYNAEWYKRNFSLLFLAFCVNVEKVIVKVI